MLNVKCQEHLDEVEKFAIENGLYEQLDGQLKYLHTYGGGEGDPNYCRCDLYVDFAPHSFAFMMFRTEAGKEPQPWFSGGLIYQGPSCSADGSFPSLTVSLAHGHGWFVHT